jgi:autotransporter passenger strand-loop-strand repeat protein
LVLSAGQTITNTNITSGGAETVLGVEIHNNGGAFGIIGGLQTISSGGVVSGENAALGGVEVISSGGSSISATANNGGAITVMSGGTLTSAQVDTNGTETFWIGATVSNTALAGPAGVQSGALLIEGGLTVSSGVSIGLKPLGVALFSFNLPSSGVTSNLDGLVGATVLTGGTVTVSSGGSMGSGSVLAGGYEDVLSGGHLVSSESVGSGGVLEVASRPATRSPWAGSPRR